MCSQKKTDDSPEKKTLSSLFIKIRTPVLPHLVFIKDICKCECDDIHDGIPSDRKERNHIRIQP